MEAEPETKPVSPGVEKASGSRARAKVASLTATKRGQPKLANVSYPNHHKVFTERLWHLLTRKSKIDLEIGGVGMHRLIVDLLIPQLAQMLEAAMGSGEKAGTLDLRLNENQTKDDFKLLIEFVYRGSLVGLSSQQLKALRQLTDKLKVPLQVVKDDPGSNLVTRKLKAPLEIKHDPDSNVDKMGGLTANPPAVDVTSSPNVRRRAPQSAAKKRRPADKSNLQGQKKVAPPRPRRRKPEASSEPTTRGRKWITLEEAMNVVPEGASVMLRGNKEVRRNCASASRRGEAVAAWSMEMDQSVQSIMAAGESGTTTLEHDGTITMTEDAIATEYVSCEVEVGPDNMVVVVVTDATLATDGTVIEHTDEPGEAMIVDAETVDSTSEFQHIEEVATAATSSPPAELHMCTKCPFRTHCPRRFASHLKNYHDPSRVMLKCDTCGLLRATKRGMERHLLTHKDEQPLYECKHCDYSNPRKANFLLHMLFRHNRTVDDKPIPAKFLCDICSFGCALKSQLIKHVVHEHSPSAAPFKCPHCSYCTDRNWSLQKHINSVHLDARPMICHTCGHGCRNPYTLKVHERSHTKERPYRCSVPGCDKAFSDFRSLKRHGVSHGDQKPFHCDQCSYSCKLRYNLRAHVKRHHRQPEQEAVKAEPL